MYLGTHQKIPVFSTFKNKNREKINFEHSVE